MFNISILLLGYIVYIYLIKLYMIKSTFITPCYNSLINKPFKVRTMTYNVFSRWYNISGDEGQIERMSAIPEAIYRHPDLGPDIDIITINEAWCPTSNLLGKMLCGNDCSGNVLIDEMAKYGWLYHSDIYSSSGLIIFSKWKILLTKKYVFNTSSSIEKFVNKGVIYARILKNNHIPINIFSAHLQADCDITWKYQLKELKNSFVNSIHIPKNKSEIVLFQGDFNAEDTNQIETILHSKIPQNIGDHKHTYDPTSNKLVGKDGLAYKYNCFDTYKNTLNCSCCIPKNFDHILYCNDQVYRQPVKSTLKIIPLKGKDTLKYKLFDVIRNINELSDHYPVVSDLFFE